MRVFLVMLFLVMMIGCAHSRSVYQSQGKSEVDFEDQKVICGSDGSGGYFLFGPAIIIFPVVGMLEGYKYYRRGAFQECMETAGWQCIEGCR